MKLSYGFIETQGYIAAIEAADAMVKAAKVELVRWRRVGGALVLVVVQGELSACQAAVDAGKAAAERVGRLISAHVIPNPFDDTQMLVDNWLGGKRKAAAPKPEAHSSAPAAGKGRGRKKRSAARPRDMLTEISAYLAAVKDGLGVKPLAEHFKIDTAQMRVYLKQLMDEHKIEKVQQRYFSLKGKKGK